jgi:hypothetical protein
MLRTNLRGRRLRRRQKKLHICQLFQNNTHKITKGNNCKVSTVLMHCHFIHEYRCIYQYCFNLIPSIVLKLFPFFPHIFLIGFNYLLSNISDRPSVILLFRHYQFPFIILVTVAYINSIEIYGYVMRKYRSNSNLVMVRWFWQCYAPFTVKIKWIFQFPFIISPTVLHIELKLYIWIFHKEIQAKFEFGHGSMNFDSVMPLSLWK